MENNNGNNKKSGSFLRDLKNSNKEFLNEKLNKNTSLLGMIKNILLGSLIFGVFIVLVIIIFFYYNQDLLKQLINSLIDFVSKNSSQNVNKVTVSEKEETTIKPKSSRVKKRRY